MGSRAVPNQLSRVAFGVTLAVGIAGTVTSVQAAPRSPQASVPSAPSRTRRTGSTIANTATRRNQGAQHTPRWASKSPKVLDGRYVLRVIRLTATAYGPSVQDNAPYGATNSFGAPLTPGTVAVDPAQIPLGTDLVVTGYRTMPVLPSGGFVGHALDTGGAIGRGRIDVFLNAPSRIVQAFGIQKVTAYVLGARVSHTPA